jgi:hypothetical protein
MKYEEIKDKQQAEHKIVKENLTEIDAELEGITSRNEKNEEELRSFRRVDSSEPEEEKAKEEQSDVEDFLGKINNQIDEIAPEDKKKEEE